VLYKTVLTEKLCANVIFAAGPSQVKTALFSCQGFHSGFMYFRPHYLKNAPGPPQILPQIQDGGQKSNMAAKMHIIVFLRADFWTFFNWLWCTISTTNDQVIKSKKIISLIFKCNCKKIHNGDRPYLGNFKLPWVIRSTSCLVLYRVEFSGTADRTALFPVRSNPRWRLAAILKISSGHI